MEVLKFENEFLKKKIAFLEKVISQKNEKINRMNKNYKVKRGKLYMSEIVSNASFPQDLSKSRSSLDQAKKLKTPSPDLSLKKVKFTVVSAGMDETGELMADLELEMRAETTLEHVKKLYCSKFGFKKDDITLRIVRTSSNVKDKSRKCLLSEKQTVHDLDGSVLEAVMELGRPNQTTEDSGGKQAHWECRKCMEQKVINQNSNTTRQIINPEVTKNVKQVEVECIAPYAELHWANMGKEKDGMLPEYVQHALALKPPYHLASLLKLAGYSTKGISATNKNTMVFMVMKGEVTVVLNMTQFVVSRGDSFFVPTNNTYNIINMKAEEVELFLVQYKYEDSLL